MGERPDCAFRTSRRGEAGRGRTAAVWAFREGLLRGKGRRRPVSRPCGGEGREAET